MLNASFAMPQPWLWRCLTGTELRVWCELTSFGTFNEKTRTYEQVRPARQTIANNLDISVDTVDRCINSLARRKIINRIYRFTERGSQDTNAYRMPVDKPVDISQGAAPTPQEGRTDAALTDMDIGSIPPGGGRTHAAGGAASMRPNPEPLTQNPVVDVSGSLTLGWAASMPPPQTDDPVTQPNGQEPTMPDKQESLFSLPRRMPERNEIVYDWLRTNGYPDVTPGEVVDVLGRIVAAYGVKVTPGYLRAMASQSGGGFAGFYTETRKAIAAAVDAQLVELRTQQPPCEHGTPAGSHPHPTNGALLCVLCRRKLPSPTSDTPEPLEDRARAIVAAFQLNYEGVLDAGRLVRLAQEARVLSTSDAPVEDLIVVGAKAGIAGVSIFSAIKRGLA